MIERPDSVFNKKPGRNFSPSLRRKVMLLIVLLVLAVLLLLFIIIGLVLRRRGDTGTDRVTATPSPVATVTPAATAVPVSTETPAPGVTNTPSATPSVVPTLAPTFTPTASPLPTLLPTAEPTAVPTAIPTPQPSPESLSAEQVYGIFMKYTKEQLALAKELSEYIVEYDSSATRLRVATSAYETREENCYCFIISELVNGKKRNRGEFYITDDGKRCYVFDDEIVEFVPLPIG